MATKTTSTTSTTSHPLKNWNIIYPAYINSKKTLSEGRRVAKEFAVEDPTAVGLLEGVKILGLPCEIEPYKTHPKDFGVYGRIRVKIFGGDDKPLNPAITSKDDLLRKLGKAIPSSQSASAAGDQGKKGKKGKK